MSAASLLAALDTGRNLSEFTNLLSRRSDNELPGTWETVINDVTRRAGQLTDPGHVRVVECADAALAALLVRACGVDSLSRPCRDMMGFTAMGVEGAAFVRKSIYERLEHVYGY